MARVPYISTSELENLRNNIDQNLDRYLGNGFSEHANEARWRGKIDLEYDDRLLATLRHSEDDGRSASELDRENSEIVGKALKSLSPQMAAREEIWTRLSHVECFEYSKSRWISGVKAENLHKKISKHMFAVGRTGKRDDHAISRLWWNYRIASELSPKEPDVALYAITKTADIRLNLVERAWTASRLVILRGIVKLINDEPEATRTPENFRRFMKQVNLGGGVVFEGMESAKVDIFLERCLEKALSIEAKAQ